LRDEDIVGIEVGSITVYTVEFLKNYVKAEFIILDPRKLVLIYKSLKKNDQEDALKIARLISVFDEDELPTVYLPNDKEKLYREILNDQYQFAKVKKNLLNRLHGIFTRYGHVEIKKSTLANKTKRAEAIKKLIGYSLTSAKRIQKYLEIVENDLKELEQLMKDKLVEEENAEFSTIALSMPGFGPITVFSLLAHVGDGSRFKSVKQISSYVGLVPRINISGDKTHYGRIVPGCHQVKRLIVQSSWSHMRTNLEGPIKEFYKNLSIRVGKKKAAVASARKMIETFYSMIKKKEIYWPTDLEYLSTKLKKSGMASLIPI
jgi:transposase